MPTYFKEFKQDHQWGSNHIYFHYAAILYNIHPTDVQSLLER